MPTIAVRAHTVPIDRGMRVALVPPSGFQYDGIMKTTVDIPEEELADAMRFTRARTKREAIVTAIVDFNRRRRMAELARRAGSCDQLMTADELQRLRRRG
jgi:Arc/MetJ family transcription regulator